MTQPDRISKTASDALDRSALSGVAWSGAAKWSTQIVSWAITILVARILVPSDYGLLSMASVFLGIVLILSEFGVGTAVVTLRELKPEQLGQLNTLAVLLGLSGTLVTALAAYPLGVFFRAPNLPPVVMVVGLTFVISSLQTVPANLLRRELNFRVVALIDFARGILVPLVTLAGALLGLRYWALALGSLFGALMATALTLYYRREPFVWPTAQGLAGVLGFNRDLLIGRLGFVVYQNGDFAVAGRRLGESAVGSYSLARTLSVAPIERVSALLADVTPSLFSAVQNDRVALRRYFLNLSEILCLGTFPAAVGLALVSADLVTVVLGPKWAGTAGPLALLALYAGARSVTSIFGYLFNAARETRFAMWTSLGLAVALLVGFIAGSNWGAAGIAAAWLVIHPSFSVYSFSRVSRVLDLRGAEYLRALRLGLDGTALMGGVVLSFQWVVAPTWPPAVRLVTAIALGALTFAAATWLMHRTRLKQIIAWLRRARHGQAGPVETVAPTQRFP